MTQQIINYDEEMVGANHPTKSDTLNRAFLISHDNTGGMKGLTGDPGSPQNYQYYWRSDTKLMRIYDGSTWRTIGFRFATGTYTGNGNATQAVTGLGFQPRYVHIIPHAVKGRGYKTDQMGAYACSPYNTGDYYNTDYIISLDADGFTVGDGTTQSDNRLNNNTTVYSYVCWG